MVSPYRDESLSLETERQDHLLILIEQSLSKIASCSFLKLFKLIILIDFEAVAALQQNDLMKHMTSPKFLHILKRIFDIIYGESFDEILAQNGTNRRGG